MIRYETDQTPKKWTRNELMTVAGAVVLLLCIWALIAWKNYDGDETQRLLARTHTQLAAAKEKIASLESRLAETEKQLADANSKVMALTSVAARAPQLPVHAKQWKDSPSTYAIALQNEGDEEISVHLTVSNPERSRPREQEFYIKAHQTINTPLRIYPHDTAIVTADGFATRTEKME
jgi:septal ring factor EnvC (AmiA/AmiB activator)